MVQKLANVHLFGVVKKMQVKNIAGRLPEKSSNSFVDLQSQKNIKKDRPKN